MVREAASKGANIILIQVTVRSSTQLADSLDACFYVGLGQVNPSTCDLLRSSFTLSVDLCSKYRGLYWTDKNPLAQSFAYVCSYSVRVSIKLRSFL
jgi:hypothetical protein